MAEEATKGVRKMIELDHTALIEKIMELQKENEALHIINNVCEELIEDLERENTRLKRAVADLTLDKLILQEALEGNY